MLSKASSISVSTMSTLKANRQKRSSLSRQLFGDLTSISDGILILTSGILAHILYFPLFSTTGNWTLTLTGAALGASLTVLVMRYRGIHTLSSLLEWSRNFGKVLSTWALTFLGLIAIAFLVKSAGTYSRGWAITWFFFSAASLGMGHLAYAWALRKLSSAGHLRRNIAVVGAGSIGKSFIDHASARDPYLHVVGVFDTRAENGRENDLVLPVNGDLEDLIQLAQNQRVDDIIIALPHAAKTRILSIAERLAVLPINVKLSPDEIGYSFLNNTMEVLGGVHTQIIHTPPISNWARVAKALEDRILAVTFLVLAWPLFGFIALAIKLNSPGPVFFKQQRHGFNHEIIKIYKFRSMTVQEDGATVKQATKSDQRVTKIGFWLRRTSLDELPQLINVALGEMSLVGPRPHALAHNEEYAELIKHYAQRHKVKPGITGWAQINGYRGETTDPRLMEKRIQHDLFYIEHWSIWLDLKIIALTPFKGLVHPNAY